MAVFWGVSVPLYLDQPWTRPIWRACRARSGRDWMLNSGVTRLDAAAAGAATHAIAAAIFADVPLLAVARNPDGSGIAAQADAGAPRHASSSASASGRLARPKPTRTWPGSS